MVHITRCEHLGVLNVEFPVEDLLKEFAQYVIAEVEKLPRCCMSSLNIIVAVRQFTGALNKAGILYVTDGVC